MLSLAKLLKQIVTCKSIQITLLNQWFNSACLAFGFRLYLSSSSTTCFCLFPIYSSKAFKVCYSMATVCFKDSIVYGRVCSTRTPPITFQHFLSPCNGSMLVSTSAFSLLSSSSSRYLLKIYPYSALTLLQLLRTSCGMDMLSNCESN